VNCFEGGAICTNDDKMAGKARLMKNFGFSGLDNVVYLGTNGKINEASAAMGITSLESIDDFIAHNQENYHCYTQGLATLAGCRVLTYNETESNNFQYIVLEIDEAAFGLPRDHLIEYLHAENVRARRYFFPGVHRMEPYRSYYPNAGLLLPETERLVARTMCLPTGTAVSKSDVNRVCELIRFIQQNAHELRRDAC
jgi:dTDP-4-amino-4,6-dideoxygalactose transaminase